MIAYPWPLSGNNIKTSGHSFMASAIISSCRHMYIASNLYLFCVCFFVFFKPVHFPVVYIVVQWPAYSYVYNFFFLSYDDRPTKASRTRSGD